VDLLLVLFEKPAIPGFSVPYWGTMLIELACLSYFVIRVVHGSLFTPDRKKYWKDIKNIAVITLVVVTVLDMFIYIILYNSCCASSVVRGTRVLRPLFVVNLNDFRQIRKAFRNIRKTLPDIISVLILLLLAIALFSLLGYMLFKDRNLHDYKNRPYFNSYLDTYFNLYVLVTSANSPDIMMPAYNSSGWYALFFIIFTIICMYIFMSIFLAVVYHNYRKHLKKEVKKSVKRRCDSLSHAFTILKTKVDGQWVVTEERFREMMHYVAPKRSLAQLKLLWEVLDEKSCGYVGQAQFYHIVDLVDVEVVEIKDTVTIFEEYFPRIYKSKISQLIIKVAKTMAFRLVFDVVIVINAIFIGLDFEDKNEDKGEAVFLVLFNLEIAFKLYAFGFTGFLRRFWNVFDFLVIEAATMAEIIEAGKEAANEDWKPSQTALDILMVLRVLRLLKIIGGFDRFKNIVRTILQVGPAITTYGALILILYYVYAIIGMEIFGGLVEYYPLNTNSSSNASKEMATLCGGHEELNGTEFSDLQYCKNNFNYVTRSFVVLFDLMVVNQWHGNIMEIVKLNV
jgi:two pore calcium channel protein 3